MKERIVIGDITALSTAFRDVVHRNGIPHYCVHLICYSGNAVFLQRRSHTRRRNAGLWTSVSGHINERDATRGVRLVLDTNVALTTLVHETQEELGALVRSHQQPHFCGEVVATSRGGGETCICRTFVFSQSVESLPTVMTPEVAEIAEFEIDRVVAALQTDGGLVGADMQRHGFADNFRPVFERFATAVLAVRPGA